MFISYHHANDQAYKTELLRQNELNRVFIDGSVDTGDVSDSLSDEAIRRKIRDDYLRDTTVTVLLVGTETINRKHIDWEIYSSMFDGTVNKKSGVLVINLPSTSCTLCTSGHPAVKDRLYRDVSSWTTINDRNEYERRYPLMPARIIDNLLASDAKISVVEWDRIISDWEGFGLLLDEVYSSRSSCTYDLRRPLRRRNS